MAGRSSSNRWVERLGFPAAALLLALNLFIFGTYEIISANGAEFTATFADIVPILALLSLAMTILFSIPSLLSNRFVRETISSVVIAIAFLMWIEGSFLRWGYGVFDGRPIDWGQYTWQGWLDLSVWLVILVLAVRLRKFVARHALFVATTMIVLQTAGLVLKPQIETTDKTVQSGEVADRIPQAFCRLSATRNVFHILMDSFQSDVFLEIVEEEGDADTLDGFVVFRDNMSTGGRTVLSIPAIFSTNIYDGTLSESAYFHAAESRSFHTLFYDNGYTVNLLPHISMEVLPATNHFMRPAEYALPQSTRLRHTAGYLVDVSAFRQVPHFVKRFVYNNQNWLVSNVVGHPPDHASFHQKTFFRDYTDRLEIAGDKPAYHFIHLMPPHPPFVTNADGTYSGEALDFTRENYKNEARYIYRLFIEFLGRLKTLGIYDSSIILLHGDHGVGFEPVVGSWSTNKQMGKVSALLTVKAEKAKGRMRVSQSQTSLTDIPSTLLGAAGLTHDYSGVNVLGLDPRLIRDRRVVFVADRAAREPTVNQFVVRGSVYDSTAWNKVASTKVVRELKPYRWGDIVRFGVTGNGDDYLRYGWSTTSPTIHWNNDSAAEMAFKVDAAPRDVRFKIKFFPHVVEGKVDQQRIRVKINGISFGEVVCVTERPREMKAVFPKDEIKDGVMVFAFEFPDAISPRSINEGRDTRKLAMGLFSFEAFVISEYTVQKEKEARDVRQ